MKLRGGLWTAAWVLLGLLVIAGGLLAVGSRESRSRPSATSYAPSGTRAFAELLRDVGYEVAVSRSAKPKLSENDLALGFVVDRQFNLFMESRDLDDPQEKSAVVKTLEAHIERGGRALIFLVPSSFVGASKTAGGEPYEARLAGEDAAYQVTRSRSDYSSTSYHFPVEVNSGSYDVAPLGDDKLFAIYDVGKGIVGYVTDGTGATNRFLDAADNAAFAVRLAGFMSPERGRIMILDALNSSPIEDGLIATIGPWASAAWWQLILLFIVIAYSLGKRFGLPIGARYRQRGGRELVEAYADVMKRSRKPQIALKRVVQEADREVRKAYSISADLPPKRRNEVLPEGLGAALSMAELAAESPLVDTAAAKLLRQLEAEMAPIRREPIARKRKRR